MKHHNVLLTFASTTLHLSGVIAQINLGSFFLHPQNGNGFDMGMGQGANILGFGGDRSFNLAGNRAGFAMGSNNGALVGGERVGLDGGIGAGRDGLEMGSQMQFGNNPNPMHPAGQLGGFLENVKNFFSFLGRGMPMPPQAPPSPPFSFGNIGMTRPPTLIGTEGNNGNHKPQPWFPEPGSAASGTSEPNFTPDFTPEKGSEEIVGGRNSGSSGGVNDGNAFTSKSASTEEEVIGPNNGEPTPNIFAQKPKSAEVDFSVDEQTDEIFNAQTEKPRQLPGLVEFA